MNAPAPDVSERPSLRALQTALSDPSAYPYAPDTITLRQTHISLLALAPPYVYKIKKARDLGFLDFTTLDARRHYCEREVALNRRLCAETYLGVVPISRTDDGLVLESDTAPVEYAVKMRYLDPDGFLNHRLEAGTARDEDLDRVIDTLVAFYQERDPSPEVAEAGRVEHLRVNTDENFAQTTDHVGTLLTRPAYEALQSYTNRVYDREAERFNRRRAAGRIVDGHGDLHLDHVHLSAPTDDGGPRVCIYDCIEFNDRFRHVDVANDLAFLAMDLDVHGRVDWSRRLARRMADRLGDPGLLALLDFYKSYRAYVRGKVEGFRAMEDEVPADEQAASRKRARRYYRWALRYALAGTRPVVVVVMGRAGTGKSTQARALADALGWDTVASDRVRKRMMDVPLHERPDTATRRQMYTAEVTAQVYERLQTRALERAASNQGTVLDATYSRRSHRDALRSALQARDIPYLFVELTAPNEARETRLQARETASEVVSDARLEDVDTLDRRYDAPDALEDARHVRVPAADDPDATTLAILKHLMRFKPETPPPSD
jgi:hypothetical protein